MDAQLALAKFLAPSSPVTAAQPNAPSSVSGGLAIVTSLNVDGTIGVTYNGGIGIPVNPLGVFDPVVGQTIVLLVLGTQLWALGPATPSSATPVVPIVNPAGHSTQVLFQSIPTGVATALNDMQDDWSFGDVTYNSLSNNWTVGTAGQYLVIGSVDWETSSVTAGYQAILFQNGSSVQSVAQQLYANPVTAGAVNPQFVDLVQCAAGDTLGLGAYQQSGSNQQTATANNRTRFSFSLIG